MKAAKEQNEKLAQVLRTVFAAAGFAQETVPVEIRAPDGGSIEARRSVAEAWSPYRDAETAATGYQLAGSTAQSVEVVLRRADGTEVKRRYDVQPGGLVLTGSGWIRIHQRAP